MTCYILIGHEMVGNYNANFYSINGMVLETRKRREHLTKEDLQKNKALLENFATGNTQYLEEQNGRELTALVRFTPTPAPLNDFLKPPILVPPTMQSCLNACQLLSKSY